MTFEVEAFVAACRHAAADGDPSAAVRDVVAAAIADPASIDAALGTNVQGARDMLYSAPELTVQRIGWPAAVRSSPHEHRVWAVVGVYAGTEVNWLFQRSSEGLVEQSVRHLERGDVLVLDETAIHAVANPRRGRTEGLHVYGGDIVGISRSAWGPDGREVPFGQDSAGRLAMFRLIRDIATERGQSVTHEQVYDANRALCSASDRASRYLDPEEARAVVTTVWGISGS